jgi:hypothetical protein
MTKFRKKPVEVEAFKYSPNGPFPDWIIGKFLVRFPNAEIDTLEGKMLARPGDYIIKGIKGECYPCQPDIFEATYEIVDGQ